MEEVVIVVGQRVVRKQDCGSRPLRLVFLVGTQRRTAETREREGLMMNEEGQHEQ